jgi:hypothetical protein
VATVAVLTAEHDGVVDLVGRIRDRLAVDDVPSWPDRLRSALALLQDHILAEQDGVFPAALGTLRPEQWERVEAVRVRVGSPIPG